MSAVDDLAFFQQLARAGSLTGAARELGLSLSAVSKRLKLLEARLGVQLAHRTTRSLALTPEGERYLARGAAILDDLAELEDSLNDPASALSGRICVNATFGFGRRHIAPLLSEFAARHAGLEIQLELTNFPLSLSDAGVDIGIRIGMPPDSRVVARRLLANRRVLCAAPSYLQRAAPLRQPEDLVAHECLIVREIDSDYALWRFEHVVEGEGRSVRVGGRLSSNDGEAVHRLALDGHGIMLRSWWDAHEALARGDLVELLPEWRNTGADIYAVYAHRRHVPARVRACVAFLVEGMAGRVPPLPR